MSIPMLQAVAVLSFTLALTTAARAAPQAHPCSSVTDPAKRLTCYDKAFPPGADARSGMDIQAEKEQAIRDFGLNKAQLRVRDPERMRDVTPDQINAAVIRINARPTGERVIVLDSGQTWLLTEVTSRGYLKVGDRVVVRAAALGSFMLVTPKGVPLRARRIN